MTLRLDDPTDNRGRGWRLMTREELVGLFYVWLKVMPKWRRRDLNERNAMKADQSARRMAEDLADRFRDYPIFIGERLPPHVGVGMNGRSTGD